MLKKFDYDKMPVVDIVNEILVDASKREASDIHFDPQEGYMKVRIRIDGELIDYTEVPNEIKKNLITRIKILSEMNITESRLPQDGAIKGQIDGIDMDLRVSALPTNLGEKIVIRILDYSMSVSGIERLGFSEKNLQKVLHMINVPNGIVLVTGATGTGKSTTVYSMLQKLNHENTNIITVEDPIEMNLEGVNQVQANSEIGLNFATALRSILRQDPNIIMIGEIRDTETARIAVRASITGHLVLSTIHTNNSLNTIERLLDMDVERYLLSSALTGIISQKLARKICPKCRKLRPVNDYEKNLFKEVLGKDVKEIYTTEGCDECGNGFKGRIAIQEVLVINQEIKDAISNNIRKEKLRELVYKNDVVTLLQDGLEKVLNGDTTFEELLKLIELDDEDLRSGHGLEKALDYTNISKTSTKKEENEKETTNEVKKEIDKNENNKKEEKIENSKIEPKEHEHLKNGKFLDESINIQEKEKNKGINDLDIALENTTKDVGDLNVLLSETSKKEIDDLNFSLDDNTKKHSNLDSFLNEAQELLRSNKSSTTDENQKDDLDNSNVELDDYGLSETIKFINEYKKGLKKIDE